MTNLWGTLVRSQPDRIISMQEYAEYFTFNGLLYELGLDATIPRNSQEEITPHFQSAVRQAYKRNGIVFACILVRLLMFSEGRFQYQRQGESPFGTTDLAVLEQPWPNATTRDLLARMEQDASLAGNFFGVLRPGPQLGQRYIKRLRPDWVTIVGASEHMPERAQWDPDAVLLGYAYHPGGPTSGNDPLFYTVEEVAHYAPIPDPEATWRGMSWLQPVVEEVRADKAATTHKLKFFENGATPNLVVIADRMAKQEAIDKISQAIAEKQEGLAHAYKTLVLGGGADAKVVGADMRQVDFKVTQGAGETRVAAAAGVPPIIVGLSEGLAAATYSNYAQALRRFADLTMRPLWGFAADALAKLVPVPGGSARLVVDPSGIAALQEGEGEAAVIQTAQATQIRTLVDGGFDPQSVVAAVMGGDLARLQHTGMYSVQLHPPGTVVPTSANPNGNTPTRAAEEVARALAAVRKEA